jgi:hypothetical protein
MRHSRTNTARSVCAGILLAAGLVLSAPASHAQFSFQNAPPPDVLHPAPSRWWIGPQLGVNLNTHGGDYFTDFCECSFKDGTGTGLTAGVEIGHMLSPWLGMALKLVYNDLQAQYSSPIRLPSKTVDDEIFDVDYTRELDVRLGYLMLNPVIQVQPFPFLYLFAGPAIGIRTTAKQDYTLRISDPTVEFEYTRLDEKLITDDSGEIPNAESLRADLRAGLGLNFRIGRGLRLAPEVSYGIPLTTIADDDDWKASAIHLTAVLKIDL